MELPLSFFCLLLTVGLISGNLLTDDRIRSRKPEEDRKVQRRIQRRQNRALGSEDDHDCQEGGGSPGESYLGRMNVSASGLPCKAWVTTEDWAELGEHNHCRNPDGDSEGVWCDTSEGWEHCSVPICNEFLKVLDFAADNDCEDNDGEWTGASLNAGSLPESFTICSSYMTEAWLGEFTSSDMFGLMDEDGDPWGKIASYASEAHTEYDITIGPVSWIKNIEVTFMPFTWTRGCLSLDSVAKKVRAVVDGHPLGEEEYKREEDEYRPANITLVLGTDHWNEYPIMVTNVNMFNSSLSVERMVELTTAGEEECGAPGDLVSWEEAEWTLYSKAKVIEVDRKWEGPCRRESQVQVFTADFEWHKDCMQHCEKNSKWQITSCDH